MGRSLRRPKDAGQNRVTKWHNNRLSRGKVYRRAAEGASGEFGRRRAAGYNGKTPFADISRFRDSIMPSPFPGMDPYLEDPRIFAGLHGRLITYLAEALEAVLPRRYVANIG